MRWPRARYDHCLITGASSGIGRAFAEALAGRAGRLTLAARREDRLRALADEISRRGPARCTVAVVDLATAEGPARLVELARRDSSPPVDLLVNNAGFGHHGGWAHAEWELWRRMLSVNVAAAAELLHRFWGDLTAAPGRGAINVASTAAFQPLPWFAAYAATKGFLRSLSLALAAEARGRGVRVLCLCPGPTATEFGAVAGSQWRTGRLSMTADVVVATALRAYERGKAEVIPGLTNRVGAFLAQRAPQRLLLAAVDRVGRRAAPPDRLDPPEERD